MTIKFFTKLVSTRTAAETLSGFSYPRVPSNAYTALEERGERNEWFFRGMNPDEITDHRAEASRIIREVEEAKKLSVTLPVLWEAWHSAGDRWVSASESAIASVSDYWGNGWEVWVAHDMRTVEKAVYTSSGSRCTLSIERTVNEGEWLLTFTPPSRDPEYRGNYWAAFARAVDLYNPSRFAEV